LCRAFSCPGANRAAQEQGMEEQGKGVRVSNCPFGWDVCYPSCYWRKGNRCYYASKQGGRIIKPKKEGGELQLMELAIEKGYRVRLAIAQILSAVRHALKG